MLNLEKELPNRSKLSFWPFVDLCAIGLFFTVFASKFVVIPGLTLQLPELGSSQVAIASVYDVITVTEVKGQEMIFFQDSVLNLETLGRLLDARERPALDATLLVKADVRVSMQTLSSLSELAVRAGYANVQLATEERARGRRAAFAH